MKTNLSTQLMSPLHPLWDAFAEGLQEAGCGGTDHPNARGLLPRYGIETDYAIDLNIELFEQHCSCCDCEIWLNLDEDSLDEDVVKHFNELYAEHNKELGRHRLAMEGRRD